MPSARAAGAGLPSGSVTFLMSDIEGSTRLFHRWGSAYLPLLAEHRALLRDAIARHGGVEVDTEGDALLSAFPDETGGLAAALDGQRALGAHAWPEGGEVRVRMGLHTGEAEPQENGYVSLAVHQVARICAAGHGGQVLVSRATADGARDDLPDRASLTPLGSFQLRGFPSPERLFQLRHPDLREDFPALRAMGVVAHNLLYPRTGLVGREAERRALADQLATTGLLTLVGPGGVGKTRLAVQVAFDVLGDEADGAWLVELAPLTDPSLVPRTVAAALRLPEQPGRTVEDVLVEGLAGRELLLLLDNCEHLLDAVAALVDHLAQRCPGLTVLATSREPLDVDGELVWRLAPLATAAGDEGSAPSEAARLFADRAALVRPGFELTPATAPEVERLVAHLDGLPLAIELAAAAMADRPLSAVAAGLSDRFGLLSRGRRSAPERHQTLRAALAWSLDLLAPEERTVLARLSVFARGGTVPAAVEVCAAPPVGAATVAAAMQRLVRASLVQLDEDERWSMAESVRELAALELADGEGVEEAAAGHRRWFAARVEAVSDDVGRSDRSEVMRELAADHDNVRRALDSATTAGDADTALRLAAAMGPYWTSAGHWTEGAERLGAALALPGGDPSLRGRALVAAGQLALLRGELDTAEQWFEQARPLAHDDETTARVLSGAGYVAFRRSRLDEAERDWQQGLTRARAAHAPRVTAGLMRSMAIAAGSHGDQDRALQLLGEALSAAREARDDQLVRQLLGSSGEVALWLGDYQQAADRYGDALDVASRIGDLSARPLLLAELGWVALLRGDVPVADRLAVEAADLADDVGNRRMLVHALRLRGEALLRRGRHTEADGTMRRALAVAERYGAPAEIAGVRCSLASTAYETLRLDDAAELAEAARALSALPHPMRLVTPEWVLGAVALARGDAPEAVRWFTTDDAPSGATGAPRHRAAAAWGRACAAAIDGRTVEAATAHLAGLTLRVRLLDRLGIVDSLVGLAATVVAASPTEVPWLLATAAAERDVAGAVPTPRQQAEIAAVERRVAAPATGPPAGVEDVAAVLARATELVAGITGVGTVGTAASTPSGT